MNDSWSTLLQSPAEIDLLAVNWSVPHIPSYTQDVNQESFWPGASNAAPGAPGILNQPVMEYQGYPDTHWKIHSESYSNDTGGSWDDVTGDLTVNFGDYITSYVQLMSGAWCTSGTTCPPADGTETWLIHIDNFVTGGSQVEELTETLTSFGPFQYATLMELELHGLHACDGLSPDNLLETVAWGVDQAGNSHGGGGPEAYIPSTQAGLWTAHVTSELPACSWAANADAGELQWVE